jgi:hypothetical protein
MPISAPFKGADNFNSSLLTQSVLPPEKKKKPAEGPGKFRPIPASMWNKHEEAIKIYLDEELAYAESERSDFVQKLARWKHAYKAPKSDTPKNFPIANASNLTVPVIKEMVNTLVAQLVQMTMTARPYWVIQDLSAAWAPFIDEIERFLDTAADRELYFEKAVISWIIEAAKLGTSIIEVAHEVDIRKNFSYDENGVLFSKNIIFQDGPRLYNIPLEDFWIRFNESDIQKARWVGKRLNYRWHQIEERATQGRFVNTDAIKHIEVESTDAVKKVSESIEKTQPMLRQNYEIFEVWLSWDFDADGLYEECRLYYHRATRTFVRHEFNPYKHNRRPFVRLVYFPVEHRFYGEGLPEMLESIQDEVTTQHNQRIDNATMANLKMFLKRKMVKGLMPGDPLYSGKQIEVTDVWNDIREFQMAEIYPSTIQNENMSQGMAMRLSGVSEGNMGSAMPVTRTTAFAQAALLQEQVKRVDLTVRNIRSGINEIGWFVTNLYFQFGTNGKAVAWLGEKGRIVESVFRLPERVVELGLGIKAATPTSAHNRQVQKENALALFNLMVQLYEKMLQLAQGLAPESLGPIAGAMVRSARHFMENALAAFETTNAEELLEGLTLLEKVLPDARDFGGMDAFAREAESAAIIDQLQRVEALGIEASRARDGRDRIRADSFNGRRMEGEERLPHGGPSGFIPSGQSTNS